MAETHGRFGQVYKWNGTGSDLAAEATTVSGAGTNWAALITDTDKRILSPNSSDLAFTPTNSVPFKSINYALGTAYYEGDPGVTTCTGTGAYVAAGNLVKTGYIYEWSLDFALATHDLTAFQDAWKTFGAGMAEMNGSISGFMVDDNWHADLEDQTDGTMAWWYIDLLSYDPDDDRTGDRFGLWVIFTGWSPATSVSDYIRETITFQVHTAPSFTANT